MCAEEEAEEERKMKAFCGNRRGSSFFPPSHLRRTCELLPGAVAFPSRHGAALGTCALSDGTASTLETGGVRGAGSLCSDTTHRQSPSDQLSLSSYWCCYLAWRVLLLYVWWCEVCVCVCVLLNLYVGGGVTILMLLTLFIFQRDITPYRAHAHKRCAWIVSQSTISWLFSC